MFGPEADWTGAVVRFKRSLREGAGRGYFSPSAPRAPGSVEKSDDGKDLQTRQNRHPIGTGED